MFDQFLNSDDAEVASRAQKLQNYATQYKAGQLSKSEYDELCQDVCDLSQIDDLANTVEEKAELQRAFEAMMQIASALSAV
jgi:hypothetical protein